MGYIKGYKTAVKDITGISVQELDDMLSKMFDANQYLNEVGDGNIVDYMLEILYLSKQNVRVTDTDRLIRTLNKLESQIDIKTGFTSYFKPEYFDFFESYSQVDQGLLKSTKVTLNAFIDYAYDLIGLCERVARNPNNDSLIDGVKNYMGMMEKYFVKFVNLFRNLWYDELVEKLDPIVKYG